MARVSDRVGVVARVRDRVGARPRVSDRVGARFCPLNEGARVRVS